MIRRFIISVSLLFAFSSTGMAQVKLTEEVTSIVAGKEIYFFEDSTRSLDLEGAIQLDSLFTQSDIQAPNFQYTKSAIWLRLTILNESADTKLAIEISNSQLDEIVFFQPEGSYYRQTTVGDLLPFHQRLINHQNFILPIEQDIGSQRTYYFKVQSIEQLSIPIVVGSRDEILSNNYRTDLFAGLYFGIMLVMFFYNLFIYFSVRDKSYLFYVLYILGIALAQATLLGYTYKYFWPHSSYINHLSVLIFSVLAGYGAIQFARIFLQLRQNMPLINRGMTGFLVLYGLALLIYVLGFQRPAYYILDFAALTLSIYAFYFSIHLSIKGQRTAKFFLLAWSFFMMGMFVYVARNLGWLPYTFFTKNVLLIGSGVEALLLSLALADRINILKKEKEESQAKALAISVENERLVREQNLVLEEKVVARTAALAETNKELGEALDYLKNTQTQLVNSEKMASLGQLTAGIAHEINNPINFVTSNIIPLKRDLSDLIGLLSKYESLRSIELLANDEFQHIENYKREIDYDYLKEEVNILLAGMEEGAQRTAEIVKGLRIFSRLDESDLKKVNINEGIESTLILLNSSFGGKIKLVKDFDEDAVLECYPGKLNQVIMNIANNAIQAIHESAMDEEGLVTISTKSANDRVILTIGDNGPGMTENIRNRIFEPFFTTKAIGQGTGLGLSIVYSIIESHSGRITVESEVGKGTRFIMDLPKFQK